MPDKISIVTWDTVNINYTMLNNMSMSNNTHIDDSNALRHDGCIGSIEYE